MSNFARLHDRLYFASPRSGLAAMGRWLVAAAERQRQRRRLAQLDEDALRDIGVTRDAALAEARKPFWR